MSYETDQRLKSYLDTNQLYREQLCLAILSIDKRFSEVRPRHPRGGPDGGRDIEAVFRREQFAFAAIGFMNQANDSEEQKKRIQTKFHDDLRSALDADPTPSAFFFLTNINLTVGEKESLILEAKTKGFGSCEILDRERLRITLDGPDGFSTRFQYLGIPLSVEEQASFFARWGDDIHSVISTGFQRIESTLDRVLFLQESHNVLSSLMVAFELDRTYSGDEIGHFRAFISMYLKESKHRILSVLFGSSDKANRMRRDVPKNSPEEPPGIKHGISSGQWEHYIPPSGDSKEERVDDTAEGLELVGWSSGIGMQEVKFIKIQYDKRTFLRLVPTLSLWDINEAMFLPILNSSLAVKIKCIHVFANEYKLMEIARSDYTIDETPFSPHIPVDFVSTELLDGWVRIRSKIASAFRFSFSDQTPQRIFAPRQTQNSLRGRNAK